MRSLPWLLVSLAACGGTSKAGGLGAVGGGPAGPAPTIAWTGEAPMEGGTFETTGTPAVSDDGSRILIDWEMGDGGRGYPNLRLLVVNRADKTLETRVVLDADKVEETTAPPDLTADNAFLADSNASFHWRPLASAPVEDVADAESGEAFSSAQSAKLGDLVVHFDDTAHLVIEQGGKVVVDQVKKDWLHVDQPMYAGAEEDEVCTNPIYLGSVDVDGARRLAVIGFEYHGNDTCWEPSGEYHVVTW